MSDPIRGHPILNSCPYSRYFNFPVWWRHRAKIAPKFSQFLKLSQTLWKANTPWHFRSNEGSTTTGLLPKLEISHFEVFTDLWRHRVPFPQYYQQSIRKFWIYFRLTGSLYLKVTKKTKNVKNSTWFTGIIIWVTLHHGSKSLSAVKIIGRLRSERVWSTRWSFLSKIIYVSTRCVSTVPRAQKAQILQNYRKHFFL